MAEKRVSSKSKLEDSAPAGREQETKQHASVTGAGETSVDAHRANASQDPDFGSRENDDARSDAQKKDL